MGGGLRRLADRVAPAAVSARADERVRAEARRIGDDWREQAYYKDVERYMDSTWRELIWPVIRECDFSNVVDLAAGHGRNSVKLLEVAGRLTICDINEENIEVCRRRFAGDPRVSFLVNDGVSLKELGDATVTLVYCFDAMVHFDSDTVRRYLAEFRRVLVPGGRAFCHHSNYTANPTGDVHDNPQWRNFMSRELFAHYAAKEGLNVLSSRVVDWDVDPELDCVTLLERPR